MLVFEKPSPGVEVDFTGMSEEEAVAHLMRINDSLPPDSSTINQGCGPEPEGVNPEHVRLAVSVLLAVPFGEAIGTARLELARRTGAWFYWSYATALANKELEEQLGKQAASEIIYNDDRTPYGQLRAQKLRWVMKERFDFDM